MMRDSDPKDTVPPCLKYEGWRLVASKYLHGALDRGFALMLDEHFRRQQDVTSLRLLKETKPDVHQGLLQELYQNHPCKGGRL